MDASYGDVVRCCLRVLGRLSRQRADYTKNRCRGLGVIAPATSLVVKPTFSLSVGKYMDKSADGKHFVIVLPLFRPNLSVSAHFLLPCVIVSGPQACLPDGVALRFPAAGNMIPSGWEHDSQGLGTRFPAAGNMIPKGWEHDSQGLGTRFPAAGNRIPKGWEHDSQGLGTRFPAAGKKSGTAAGLAPTWR